VVANIRSVSTNASSVVANIRIVSTNASHVSRSNSLSTAVAQQAACCYYCVT
jgi:hypothetical protein